MGAVFAVGAVFAAHKSQVVERNIAGRIGEMLTSTDPAIFHRGWTS